MSSFRLNSLALRFVVHFPHACEHGPAHPGAPPRSAGDHIGVSPARRRGRSLRLDPGDLDVLGPLGALVAVLLGALLQDRACAASSANSSTSRLLMLGREDGLVDQRVQPLLDRRRALAFGTAIGEEAGADEAGKGFAERRHVGIERAARGQGDRQRPRLVGHHLAARRR